MKQRGFTIIEVLVIIVIVLILLTLAIVNLNATKTHGGDSEQASDIGAIAYSLKPFNKTV
ncbi:MAG: hypothetical protein JWO54_209 [Candidatus Saccharibacteria bacterium]|nr:hypothetical protein [Candidatus Saccharibacteria bacterium]